MDDIEKRARELLAVELDSYCMTFSARMVRAGGLMTNAPIIQAALLAVIAALTPPEGYVLVPVEPTREMIDAYVAVDARFNSARRDWSAMLAARPEVP